MLLTIKDGNGVAQTVIALSQQIPAVSSGVADGTSQLVLAVNNSRSGWLFQNLGDNPMTLNEVGKAADDPTSVRVGSGEFFPPPGLPVSTADINVMGTIGDTWCVREWT